MGVAPFARICPQSRSTLEKKLLGAVMLSLIHISVQAMEYLVKTARSALCAGSTME